MITQIVLVKIFTPGGIETNVPLIFFFAWKCLHFTFAFISIDTKIKNDNIEKQNKSSIWTFVP